MNDLLNDEDYTHVNVRLSRISAWLSFQLITMVLRLNPLIHARYNL